MQFSAFAPFGNFSFQNSDPVAKDIFEEMLRNSGYETNFPNDENLYGKFYADAMFQSKLRNLLEEAFNQAHPLYTTHFLSAHERENGIYPLPTQSQTQRQNVLYSAKRLKIDGHLSTIAQTLKDLLGDDLVFYRTTYISELPARAEYHQLDEDHSLYSGWHVPLRVEKTIEPITELNKPITVPTLFVAGNQDYYRPRQVLLVNAGSNSRAERVTATSAVGTSSGGTISGRFRKPHDAGTLITSGHHPRHSSDKRIHHIVLRNGKAIDVNVRHAIDTVMRRLVRGTSVWQICEVNASGNGTGPFIIGESHLDACTIGEVTV